MSGIFPQGGLSQAYTALTRFAGVERNVNSNRNGGESFSSQVDQASSQAFEADDTLNAQARSSVGKEDGFKEYFVASSTAYDPNAPRGSYVNIVV